MGSNFLDNLKNAVDKGEFNSEAAKKIIDIDKLADEKIKKMVNPDEPIENSELAKSYQNRLSELKSEKELTVEQIDVINSKYEKEMERIKNQDMINQQLATLIEIEEMVKLSIDDMMSFVNELKINFVNEMSDHSDSDFTELNKKISDINEKYSIFINK